jgi:type I restriction enzyme, S subunit
MPSEWPETTVAEIASLEQNALVGGPFGSNLVSRDYVEYGVPVIRGQNMGQRWIGGEFAYVSSRKAEVLSANLARPGDVIFTQRGTLGQVALVPDKPYERYLISQSQMKLTVDSKKADPLFLYYVFRTPEQQRYIQSHAIQTGVPHTNLGILRRTLVPVPPLAQQTTIARILGSLDDRIELNQRINETLEAMARALFSEYCFNRVAVSERRTISELIDQRIVVIGDGYRAKNSELGTPGLPFIRAGELDNGFNIDNADCLANASVALARDKLSRAGDVGFTSKGTIGRVARVSDRTPRFVYSPQVCFWRSIDPSRLRPSLLYAWMLSGDFSEQVNQISHQTDMAPYVSLRDQRNMTMPFFGPAQHRIADLLDPLLDRASLNLDQNRTLARLRDALLPKVISGELRIAGTGGFVDGEP